MITCQLPHDPLELDKPSESGFRRQESVVRHDAVICGRLGRDSGPHRWRRRSAGYSAGRRSFDWTFGRCRSRWSRRGRDAYLAEPVDAYLRPAWFTDGQSWPPGTPQARSDPRFRKCRGAEFVRQGLVLKATTCSGGRSARSDARRRPSSRGAGAEEVRNRVPEA